MPLGLRPSILITLILGLFALFFLFPGPIQDFSLPAFPVPIPNSLYPTTHRMTWSSQYEGWHSRALSNPHPDPSSFTPSRSSLRFAVLRNAPVEPEGISLAFFNPPSSGSISDEGLYAVDAQGRALIVSPTDARGILDLATRVSELPETGAFRNTWVISQDRTSQPIDRLFVPKSSSYSSESGLLDAGYQEVSVQGFSKEKRELKTPVDGIEELPESLWELTGLVLEARTDAGNTPDDERRNGEVLGKVRDVLGGLF
jgi:hypothetical protein